MSPMPARGPGAPKGSVLAGETARQRIDARMTHTPVPGSLRAASFQICVRAIDFGTRPTRSLAVVHRLIRTGIQQAKRVGHWEPVEF